MIDEVVALVVAEELFEEEGAWRPRNLLHHAPPLFLRHVSSLQDLKLT